MQIFSMRVFYSLIDLIRICLINYLFEYFFNEVINKKESSKKFIYSFILNIKIINVITLNWFNITNF